MSAWADVTAEIALWRDAGRSVDLWWRDDDAIEPTPALDRLLALRRAAHVPLALAVVPSKAGETLAARLDSEDGVTVLQHGYAHVNHAGPADKKIELGLQRPAMMVLGELGAGWLALERLFGARARPILVPPWNRIAPGLVPALPEIGFQGLSTFGARQRSEPVRGFVQVNTHVDLIDWRGARGFAGEAEVLRQFVHALMQARQKPEPIGILSHHLAMDEPAWDFLKSFCGSIITTPGVRILPAHGLFASREARV